MSFHFCFLSEFDRTLNCDIRLTRIHPIPRDLQRETSEAVHYTDSRAFERLNCDDQRCETRSGSAPFEVRILSAWCLLSKRSSCKTGCLHRELSSLPVFDFSVSNGATKIIRDKSVVEDDTAFPSRFLFSTLGLETNFKYRTW